MLAVGGWIEALWYAETWVVHVQWQLPSNYQAVPRFPYVQTCCVGAGNMENRLRQYQLKVT